LSCTRPIIWAHPIYIRTDWDEHIDAKRLKVI
jgi:hypothetical protein